MNLCDPSASPLVAICDSITKTLTPLPNVPSYDIVSGSSSSPVDVEPRNDAHSVDKSAAETLAPISKSETPNSDHTHSVYRILKRVMDLERGEIKDNMGLLVVAVHAIFLESGFVVCNEDRSRLPQNWNSASSGVAVRYTVPGLMDHRQEGDVKAATVKFSAMRDHVAVYGNVSGGADVYRLHLEISEVLPLLVFLPDTVNGEEEEEIGLFKFWMTVKDRLCFPLLIDSCQKNGMPLRPCFDGLPTHLKLKILDLLPGVDIARIGCTSSEMRRLATNALGKQEFPPLNVNVPSSGLSLLRMVLPEDAPEPEHPPYVEPMVGGDGAGQSQVPPYFISRLAYLESIVHDMHLMFSDMYAWHVSDGHFLNIVD